jgi:predicted amidohydrolase
MRRRSLKMARKTAVYRKIRLPNYEVFDEKRYFDAGSEACVVTLGGVRCGINICADIWEPGAAELAHAAGAELLLVLNASPCHLEKHEQRAQVLGERIGATGIPAIYCNLVGGQDELVFDGASFALDAQAKLPDAPAAVRGSAGYCRF